MLKHIKQCATVGWRFQHR